MIEFLLRANADNFPIWQCEARQLGRGLDSCLKLSHRSSMYNPLPFAGLLRADLVLICFSRKNHLVTHVGVAPDIGVMFGTALPGGTV